MSTTKRSGLMSFGDLVKDEPTLLDLLGIKELPKPKPTPTPKKAARAVSKQDGRRLDHVQRIREQREDDTQQLGYLAKPFLLLGLPFKPVKGSYYKRTNGNDVLEITGSPEHALPFGEDILVLIWVSTLAVLNKRDGKIPRVIEFKRAADMLKAFGLPVDGRTYERMQERFLRVFYATFFYGTKNTRGRAKLYKVSFFDEIDLWFTRDLESETLPGDDFTNNRIKLSEAFAADLETHHPPIDLEAVKMWANKPGQLYFYMWLVFRCYAARGESSIPLMGPSGIKEQCGVQGYAGEDGPANFKRKVRGWLAGVKTAWPDCPVTLTNEGGKDYLTITRNRTAIRERSRAKG